MKLFLIFVSLVFATGTYAQRAERKIVPRDSQNLFRVQELNDVASATTDNILNGSAGDIGSGAVTVTDFLLQPDFARNIQVTPTATTNDVAAGDVVITGLDIDGGVQISETLSFTANATATASTTKAFSKIVSIQFPAEDSPYGAQWDVGFGDKLGLEGCLDNEQYFIKAIVNSSEDTSFDVDVHATATASNVLEPSTVPDSSNDYKFLYLENFACR